MKVTKSITIEITPEEIKSLLCKEYEYLEEEIAVKIVDEKGNPLGKMIEPERNERFEVTRVDKEGNQADEQWRNEDKTTFPTTSYPDEKDNWIHVPIGWDQMRAPVILDGRIEVQYRDGKSDEGACCDWDCSWYQENSKYDIVKYRKI